MPLIQIRHDWAVSTDTIRELVVVSETPGREHVVITTGFDYSYGSSSPIQLDVYGSYAATLLRWYHATVIRPRRPPPPQRQY